MASATSGIPLQLSPEKRHILQVLAETILPSNVGFPIAPDMQNVIVPVENLLEPAGKKGFIGIGLLLLIFEWAALIFVPKFTRFTKLPPEDRERYINGWGNSRIKYRRLMLVPIKALVCMVFFSDPQVKAGVGYDPECLVEWKP